MNETQTVEAADDLSLVNRYVQEGDAAAVELLFKRHSDLLFRSALRFMHNAADAEDAVQTAFIMVMRSAGKYRGDAGVKAWMVKILLAVCKMKIRENVRRRNREERAMEHADISNGPEEQGLELRDALKRALDDLPEHFRLPVWLHHCEGMPFEEVAAALSLPSNTVRSHASRGIAALRERLAAAGLSVSMSGIAAVLPEMAGEGAPASLLASAGNIARGGGELAEAFANLRIEGGGLPTVAKAVLAGGVLLAAGTAAVMLWPGPAPEPPGLVAQFDFDAPASASAFTVTQGTWRHVPDGGSAGSGCVETATNFFTAVVPVLVKQTPLLITYKHALGLPPSPVDYGTHVTWERYPAPMIHITGISGMKTVNVPPGGKKFSEWIESKVYVTDRWIAVWDNGLTGPPTALYVTTRAPGSKLAWFTRGIQRLEDLKIATIRPEELPDLGVYLRALDKIPTAERTGSCVLPGVTSPATGKPITVDFWPGSPN